MRVSMTEHIETKGLTVLAQLRFIHRHCGNWRPSRFYHEPLQVVGSFHDTSGVAMAQVLKPPRQHLPLTARSHEEAFEP